MPLILPGNVASATAGAYEIANSCRFNIADTAYLTRDWDGAGDVDKWTFSCWLKRSGLGSPQQRIFATSVDGSNYHDIKFRATDLFVVDNYKAADKGTCISTAVFRDPSAWMHVVVVWDSDNGTAGNRLLFYLNGTVVTAKTQTDPDQGEDSQINGDTDHQVGAFDGGTTFGGYMAEVIFCDGQAYAASDFGEFDEDSPTIWKPKDPSGLTFGTKGFWLDFEDSSALGNDVSGNNNDFTPTNLDATDQATDTPTNNFATLNSLAMPLSGPPTFSQGNCILTANDNWFSIPATMGVNTGKWYWEAECTNQTANSNRIGVISENSMQATQSAGINIHLGTTGQYRGIGYHNNALIYPGSGVSSSAYGVTYTDGDIIGILLNMDDGEISYTDNGSTTSMGVAQDNIAVGGEYYFPAFSAYDTGAIWSCNFGGCSAFTVSSGNADANGYGNFEFAVPSGYLALCSKNLGSDGG